MKYIELGNSNLKVSRLCLGCMSFGDSELGQYQWTLDYETSEKIIHKAYDYGINFFDTSNNYSDGSSERYLGKAIKAFDRDKIVVASKVYFNQGKLSKEAIHREVGKSLENLDTPYLDLLILHRFDYDTPVEETLEALNEEVQAGRIHYYGASSMYGYQFGQYCYTAKELGYQPFTTLQNHYNLIYREDERDLIPIAEQFNVSRTSFAPFAAGRLARRQYTSDSKRFTLDNIEGTRYDKTADADMEISQRVYEMSAKYNTSMTSINLAWQFAKGVASPIVGITKEKYLDDIINCFDIELSQEDIAYLEELYVPHPINCNR